MKSSDNQLGVLLSSIVSQDSLESIMIGLVSQSFRVHCVALSRSNTNSFSLQKFLTRKTPVAVLLAVTGLFQLEIDSVKSSDDIFQKKRSHQLHSNHFIAKTLFVDNDVLESFASTLAPN